MKKPYMIPQIYCLHIKTNTHLLVDSIQCSENRCTEEVLSRSNRSSSSFWNDDEDY